MDVLFPNSNPWLPSNSSVDCLEQIVVVYRKDAFEILLLVTFLSFSVREKFVTFKWPCSLRWASLSVTAGRHGECHTPVKKARAQLFLRSWSLRLESFAFVFGVSFVQWLMGWFAGFWVLRVNESAETWLRWDRTKATIKPPEIRCFKSLNRRLWQTAFQRSFACNCV